MKTWQKIGKTIGFMLICLAIYATAISAISKEIAWQRMDKDLNILEGVLEKLIQYHDQPTWASFLGDNQVQGTFVEDYGALFLISSNQAARYVKILTDSHTQSQSKQTPEPEDRQKELAAEFLGTYCNTLGQLKDTHRITLLFDTRPGEHDFTHYLSDLEHLGDRLKSEISEQLKHSGALKAYNIKEKDVKVHIKAEHPDSLFEDDGLHIVQRIKRVDSSGKVDSVEVRKTVSQTPPERLLLEATVRKRDLVAYNQAKMDAREFHKRIVFRKRSPGTTIVKKVDIMSDILDSAIQGKQSGPFSLQTIGFYQDGLGAVFFTSQNASLHEAWVHKAKAKSQPDDPHENLKSTLIETIADYGHTLKGLKTNEQIIVQVDPAGTFDFHKDGNFYFSTTAKARAYKFIGSPDEHDRTSRVTERLVFRVSKKDVDAYHAGKLDLGAFRKKVIIQER